MRKRRWRASEYFEGLALSRVILFLTMLLVLFLFGIYRALTSWNVPNNPSLAGR